nr:T9SS type A sorting domain-containing protein [Saprospiraceae bacterium]
MKYILTFISLNLCCVINLFGQSFQYKNNNPFGLEFTNADGKQSASKLLFYDVEGDGDLDVVVTGIDNIDYSGNFNYSKITYFIVVQENIGDKNHPIFAPRKPFMTDFPFPNGFFYPVMGDINHDGKADFMVSSGLDKAKNLQTLYYERKSLEGSDQYNIISTDTLKLAAFAGGSLFIPELSDFDKDGDLDLLMSGYQLETDSLGNKIQQPIFMYAKNNGSISKPQFLGWYQNPYGLENYTSTAHISTTGDLDNDGDIDMLTLSVIDTFKVISVIKNHVMPNGKPHFTDISLLAGIQKAGDSESYSPPTLADLDGDGDLDIFMVQNLKDKGVGIGYYENNFCVSSSANVNLTACAGQSVNIGNQSFTQTGQYTVNLKTIGGCDSIVHANLTFVTLNNAVNQTQNTLSAAQTGLQYQWIDCQNNTAISGATAQTFIPIASGRYAVRLKDNIGCEVLSACYDFILSGTEDTQFKHNIRIYPNPAGQFISILNDSGQKIKTVSITDSSGREVLNLS